MSTTAPPVPHAMYRIRKRGVMDGEGSADLVYYAVSKRRNGSLKRPGFRVRQIVIDDDSYVRRIPDGTWARIDPSRERYSLYELLGTGPAALDHLPFLRDVRQVGSTVVRGVPTVCFVATTPVRRLAELARPSDRARARQEVGRLIGLRVRGEGLRTAIYLDRMGRVRRIRGRLSIRLPGEDREPSHAMTDLFAFGPRPRIEAPPRFKRGISAFLE